MADLCEILQEEFLIPMEISQNRLARDIGVPPRRINEIAHGKRAVRADTALRLACLPEPGTHEASPNRTTPCASISDSFIRYR